MKFCVVICLGVASLLKSSYGFVDPRLLSASNNNVSMKDYAKRYGETIFSVSDDDSKEKINVENSTAETEAKQARFMNSLRVPGTSGSYASSNSYYMYGKLINSAVSVSFTPVQNYQQVIPPQVLPVEAADTPDDINVQNEQNVTEVPAEDPQEPPTRLNHQYFSIQHPPPVFYPAYYVPPPYNFMPLKKQTISNPRDFPLHLFGPESNLG